MGGAYSGPTGQGTATQGDPNYNPLGMSQQLIQGLSGNTPEAGGAGFFPGTKMPTPAQIMGMSGPPASQQDAMNYYNGSNLATQSQNWNQTQMDGQTFNQGPNGYGLFQNPSGGSLFGQYNNYVLGGGHDSPAQWGIGGGSGATNTSGTSGGPTPAGGGGSPGTGGAGNSGQSSGNFIEFAPPNTNPLDFNPTNVSGSPSALAGNMPRGANPMMQDKPPGQQTMNPYGGSGGGMVAQSQGSPGQMSPMGTMSPMGPSSGYPGAAAGNNSINSGSYQPATGDASSFFNGNSSIYDPFQADQNLSSTIASFGSQAIPGAAGFQQSLFDPGFNPMEQAYLANVGQQDQLQLNQQMSQLGGQFSDTPFHSGYLNAASQLGQVENQNLNNSAMQLGLNRQNLAAGAAGRILGSPLQATQQGVGDTTNMLNMIQGMQTSPFGPALSYLSNTPIFSPTVTPGTVSSGGGKKG